MTTQRRKITRRAALAGIGGLASAAPGSTDAVQAAQQPPQGSRPPEEGIPVSGKAGPGLEPLNAATMFFKKTAATRECGRS